MFSLFKLAQGEYIAPEHIENILCQSKYISQAYIEGDSLQAHVVGIIVPDRKALVTWADANSIVFNNSFGDLCKDPRSKSFLLKEVSNFGSLGSKELKGFEIPKNIYIEPEEFSIQNGLLTPTFKFKREIGKSYYAAQIANMYRQS